MPSLSMPAAWCSTRLGCRAGLVGEASPRGAALPVATSGATQWTTTGGGTASVLAAEPPSALGRPPGGGDGGTSAKGPRGRRLVDDDRGRPSVPRVEGLPCWGVDGEDPPRALRLDEPADSERAEAPIAVAVGPAAGWAFLTDKLLAPDTFGESLVPPASPTAAQRGGGAPCLLFWSRSTLPRSSMAVRGCRRRRSCAPSLPGRSLEVHPSGDKERLDDRPREEVLSPRGADTLKGHSAELGVVVAQTSPPNRMSDCLSSALP